MSLIENKYQNLREILKGKTESLLKEGNPNPKLLEIFISCGYLNDVAESVVALEKQAKEEVLKCCTKISRFLQLHDQLLQAIISNQILSYNLRFCDAVTRKIQRLEVEISDFESNIEQASETKNCEWEEAGSLTEAGCLEKIESLAVEDPDRMEKELELAKSKVDGLHDIFKTVMEQWDSIQPGVNYSLDVILEQTEFVLQQIQFM